MSWCCFRKDKTFQINLLKNTQTNKTFFSACFRNVRGTAVNQGNFSSRDSNLFPGRSQSPGDPEGERTYDPMVLFV